MRSAILSASGKTHKDEPGPAASVSYLSVRTGCENRGRLARPCGTRKDNCQKRKCSHHQMTAPNLVRCGSVQNCNEFGVRNSNEANLAVDFLVLLPEEPAEPEEPAVDALCVVITGALVSRFVSYTKIHIPNLAGEAVFQQTVRDCCEHAGQFLTSARI